MKEEYFECTNKETGQIDYIAIYGNFDCELVKKSLSEKSNKLELKAIDAKTFSESIRKIKMGDIEDNNRNLPRWDNDLKEINPLDQ